MSSTSPSSLKDYFQPGVSQSKSQFTPTVQDIHLVHKLLQTFNLPLEIVVFILDIAQYWVKESHVKYSPFNLISGNSALFFQTNPIGCEGEHLRPRKIEFQIWSSMSYNLLDCTITSSNVLISWFEASIFRQDETWQGDNRETPLQAAVSAAPLHNKLYPLINSIMVYSEDDLYSTPYWLRRDALKLKGGYQLVEDADGPFWFVASSEIYVPEDIEACQTSSWEKHSNVSSGVTNMASDSSGRKNKFMSLLQTGDLIGLWARIQPDQVSFLLLRLRSDA
jgi:hypothetical protein